MYRTYPLSRSYWWRKQWQRKALQNTDDSKVFPKLFPLARTDSLYSSNDHEKLSATSAFLKNSIFKRLWHWSHYIAQGLDTQSSTCLAWELIKCGTSSTPHLLNQNLCLHIPEDSGAHQFETHCCSVPQTLVLKMFIHFQQMRKRKIQTLNIINAFNLEKCSLSWCYTLPLLILFTRPVFSDIKVTAVLAISLTVSYLILYWFHVTLEMLLPLPKISSFLCLTY